MKKILVSLLLVSSISVMAQGKFKCVDAVSKDKVMKASFEKVGDSDKITIDNVVILSAKDSKSFANTSDHKLEGKDFTAYALRTKFHMGEVVNPIECKSSFCQFRRELAFRPYGNNEWIGENVIWGNLENQDEFATGWFARFDYDYYKALEGEEFRAELSLRNTDYSPAVNRQLICNQI